MLSHYMPKQKKNANILRFTPPGFLHPIDVPFPGRCLPVCERCKKNFKTREHCRTRDCHTGLPWSDTFLCISLDHTCTGEDGKLFDGPFVAKSMQPQPFCLQGEINPLTPICAPCKDKNYTRTYCRSNKKHRQLPWSTVHVLLSLRPDGMYPESSSERETQGAPKRRKTNSSSGVAGSASVVPPPVEASSPVPPVENGNGHKLEGEEVKSTEEVKEEVKEEEVKEEEDENKNNFDDIPPSRTFLTTVSAKKCVIDWLDVDPMIQAALSRKEEHGMPGRMPEDPGFPPYGMMPYGHMNFQGPPGKGAEDPRRGSNGMPGGGGGGGELMRGGFPGGGSFRGQEMLGGQMPFDGSHMSPRMGYGGFPSPQDMMQFDAMNNMPRVPRHGGEMPQGNMPFDGQHGMPRMPWFNQSEIASQMHFDRMSRGPGQDLMQSQVPPHMWPMANQFMRGGNGGGGQGGNGQGGQGPPPHGGGGNGGGGTRLDYNGNPMSNNGSNGGHEGDMSGYGGQGYPPHPGGEGGGMMGGGGVPNGDGGGGPPPQQQRPPQEKDDAV